MDDVFLVNVAHSFTDVGDDFSGIFFSDMMLFLGKIPEISVSHGFHDHVEVILITKHLI